MDWHAVDMEVERGKRDFDRRVEKGLKELNQRLARVEQRWENEEEDRRREWEVLAGRLMTVEEKHQHHSDGLLRKMTILSNEQFTIIREFGEEMRQHFKEDKAEWRASREATLKMLDRLPPD
jgi:hypothetical protein